MTITSPSIIVAGNEEAAHLNIADQDGVYHVGDFQSATDLVNVLMAGSASAGQAMSECAPLRAIRVTDRPAPMKHDKDVRFGVFICTCNETLAPPGALERIRDMGQRMPGVMHSELIFRPATPAAPI